MFIDDKDFARMLGEAECKGVARARSTLTFIYKHKAKTEKDAKKRKFFAEEAKRMADNDEWNLLEGYKDEAK